MKTNPRIFMKYLIVNSGEILHDNQSFLASQDINFDYAVYEDGINQTNNLWNFHIFQSLWKCLKIII